jgi:hypothetical protein
VCNGASCGRPCFSYRGNLCRPQATWRQRNTAPQDVALIYGQAMQAVRRRRAEDIYLAPLGLNTDTFLAQQREFSEGFADQITHQMQSYRDDQVEALVLANDADDAHIYSLDERGVVSCLDDVRFAAIGSGSWHAKSRLMQWGYVNSTLFVPALAASFAAKKAAEVAPGVGAATDIYVLFKTGAEPLRPDVAVQLPELYERYKAGRAQLEAQIVHDLDEFVGTLGPTTPANPPARDTDGGDPSGHSPET